jgi:hypothetical protein
MSEGLKIRNAKGLKLLLPPRISSSAGASRSFRHKGTGAGRLKMRKELKGSKKIIEKSREKREGGAEVEMCDRRSVKGRDQGSQKTRLSLFFLCDWSRASTSTLQLPHKPISTTKWTLSSTP